MIALALGTVLALLALAFVLHPLFVASGDLPARGAGASTAEDSTAGPAVAPEQDPVDVLREIEFDRATGKLSDADYQALRATYTERALATLRARDSADAMAALPAEDAAEAAVRRYRARLAECAACGPRPEADAVYCSDCGRYLPGRCARCGTAADQPGARFCGGCGAALAA